MAKKRGKDKPPKRKQSRKEVEKTLSGPVRKKAAGPRSQTLPGMARVRDAMLDKLCEEAGEGLDEQASGKVKTAAARQNALKRMELKRLSVYRHARVEFAYSPGSASVRMRKVKEDGDVAVTAEGTGDVDHDDGMGGAEIGESGPAETPF